MIRNKTVVADVEFDEQDVLAFLEQADVIQKLRIIKRTVEALTSEELCKLEEYLTTGFGAQSPDSKTVKLFLLLKQLKVSLDDLGQ